MPDVMLLSKPVFDLPRFLSLYQEMLGYSPARAADTAGLKDQPRLLACLAAFREQHVAANVKACRDVYNLLHYSFVIAADDVEIPLILEILGGMPFALTNTKIRDVQAILAVGTFYTWRNAVLRGCRQDQPDFIRVCFDKVYTQFQTLGLADAFGKLTKKTLRDKTFFLEDQR